MPTVSKAQGKNNQNQNSPSGSLSTHAYRSLREMILNNKIRPGRFYLERELEETLGISRTPIKEALVRLENEGLISIRPRHGIRIRTISADDMAEIYQVITSLECEAVISLAQKGLTKEELKSMDDATTRMESALAQDDLDAWAAADEDFHRCLLEYCGNSRLKQTVLNFWDQAHRARYFTLRFREKPVSSTKDHRRVIEEIKKGDAEKAAAIHRQHRLVGGRTLVNIIRQLDEV